MDISITKMRRSNDRLIFMMRIPIPGQTVFINTGSCYLGKDRAFEILKFLTSNAVWSVSKAGWKENKMLHAHHTPQIMVLLTGNFKGSMRSCPPPPHDDIITWKRFPHYWSFSINGSHRSAVDFSLREVPVMWSFDVLFVVSLSKLLN